MNRRKRRGTEAKVTGAGSGQLTAAVAVRVKWAATVSEPAAIPAVAGTAGGDDLSTDGQGQAASQWQVAGGPSR